MMSEIMSIKQRWARKKDIIRVSVCVKKKITPSSDQK